MTRILPEIIDYLNRAASVKPEVALILGSGLSDTVEQIEDEVHIPYESIPGYPRSTVPGHAGEFITGKLNGTPVIIARGRFHYYEGYDFEEITLPIRVFNRLGAGLVVVTNAAGSTRRSLAPGTLMVLDGHIDGTFRHTESKPDTVSGALYYSKTLLSLLKNTARDEGVDLKQGVYCWTLGPAFETAAEVQFFKSLGADAVGMSTVPEILMAGELGMDSIAISCITNYGAGISDAQLTHEEVMETTAIIKDEFNRLITTFINNYSKEMDRIHELS